MFKVMCIDDSIGKNSGEIPPFKFGDILTARQSPIWEDSFIIIEFPFSSFGATQHWYKTRFAPLSDLDETIIHEETEIKTVTTATKEGTGSFQPIYKGER